MALTTTGAELKLDAVKTLVALDGPRKAARKLGLNENTVKYWTYHYDWPHPRKLRAQTLASQKPGQITTPLPEYSDKTLQVLQASPITHPSAIIPAEIARNCQDSLHNLSKALARGSAQAAEHESPLDVSHKIKDLADTHIKLFPPDNQPKSILNIAILTGKVQPERQVDVN